MYINVCKILFLKIHNAKICLSIDKFGKMKIKAYIQKTLCVPQTFFAGVNVLGRTLLNVFYFFDYYFMIYESLTRFNAYPQNLLKN